MPTALGYDEYGQYSVYGVPVGYGSEGLRKAEEVFRKLKKKPDQKELNSMLWDAVVVNDVPLAKKLRKQGASVNIKKPDSDNMGCSILAQACRHGSLEMVQFLLRCGAKAKNDLIGSAFDSGQLDRVKIIEALLKHGAKPQTSEGEPLLLCACRCHEELELLQVLLKANVPTSKRANIGVCPLLEACSHRNWQAAQLLLKKRQGSVDGKDAQGRTALMLACRAGKEELVKALLKCKAKTTIRCRRGASAHDYACSRDIVKILEGYGL